MAVCNGQNIMMAVGDVSFLDIATAQHSARNERVHSGDEAGVEGGREIDVDEH